MRVTKYLLMSIILGLLPFPLLADDGNTYALNQYLKYIKTNKENWLSKDNILENKIPNKILDRDAKPVYLEHAIRVASSSKLKDVDSVKYAFVIQESKTQSNADYPEFDTFKCSILVTTKTGSTYRDENINMFTESNYGGGTRWAKGCDDFTISWEKDIPVLMREEMYGPFIGGNYSKTIEKVRPVNGKYILEVVDRIEGTLDEIEAKTTENRK